MEKLIFAAERADLGLHAVGENQESVVIEQVRDGIEIIRVVVGVSVLHVHRRVFELDEKQRDAVDKIDDIRPSAVEIAVNFHFFYGEEVILCRVLEVDCCGALRLRAAVRMPDCDRDAVAQQEILFLVDLHEGGGGEPLPERSDGLVDLRGRNPWVELFQRRADIASQQDLFVILPSQRPAFAQYFLVVGIDYLPAQLVAEQIPRWMFSE